MNDNIVSGGISGAITDPNSIQAYDHAEMFYETIRHIKSDVVKIAHNTGFTIDQISTVKGYLFIQEHNLIEGYKRFDPCFEIAESWRRLAFDPKNIQPHDLTLLKHELMEMRLVQRGITQIKAHTMTEKKFNYQREAELFYENLNPRHNNYKKTNKIRNGGMTH